MKKFFLLIPIIALTAASCNFSLSQLLYGGTGNMGIFRSDDVGASFQSKNTVQNSKNNLNSTSVNRLVFDPNNTAVIYMGSSAGIYQTTDRGESWKFLLTNILIDDFAIDPTNSQTVYAVGNSGNHAIIIATQDGGDSWKSLYTAPTTGGTVTTIVVDPQNHSHLIAGLNTGEIISSIDSGTTWLPIEDLSDQILVIRYGPNHHPYILTQANGLYESSDGGLSFVGLTSDLTGFILSDSSFSTVTQFLDLAFDSSQSEIIYLSTQQGVLRTVDDGAHWSYIKMPVRNEQLRTSAIAVDPTNSNNLLASVGDTMFRSTNGGVSWETKPLLTGQEVRQILIDPSSPNVVYLGLGVRK